MSEQTKLAWRGRLDEIQRQLAKNITAATRRAGDDLQFELKKQVISSGLGDKIANAWRLKMYPGSGYSASPTAMVYSKAPLIHSAFNEGVTIRTKNGERFIAIPTENTPKKFGGRRMTPMEVEDWLNGDLDFIRWRNGRPGGVLVARNKFKRSKDGRRFRRQASSAKSRVQSTELVVMFYLVPAATLKKRLDIDGAEMKTLQSFVRDLNATIGND